MTIYIKNMVCSRCRTAIIRTLDTQNIDYQNVELGEVLLKEAPTPEKLDAFKNEIEQLGFELIDDKKTQTIEKIKSEIIKVIHYPSEKIKVNFSTHLSEKLGIDYSTLSSLFSEVEAKTIEQYTIHQKIERAKELLVYDEFTLSQIADQLHYSSVAHLSNQFKKVTGLTPSYFKNINHGTRKSLDKI